MILRHDHIQAVRRRFRHARVVAIVGARQVGKSTLARQVARDWAGETKVFDLEQAGVPDRLADAELALGHLRGLVVLDEIQHRPELFRTLRVLVDRPRRARFLVLGSASPELLQQTSESLAGRISYHELPGLNLREVGPQHLDRLWLRGGFPRAFTAPDEAASAAWREDFLDTFLHRDVPAFGIGIPPETLRKFWSMLAHIHGQRLNVSELGRSLAVSDTTVRRYLDVLAQTFMVRVLAPWHESIAKRQVKAPKPYVMDSGLLHALFGIRTMADLENHPKLGASWEGFAIEMILARLGARRTECYFWAAHTGAELDLLVVRGRRRLGFEVKRTVAPTVTRSMRAAMEDLRLERLDVIHAGRETYPLDRRIRAVPLREIWREVTPLP